MLACVANIGPVQRRRRLRAGGIAFIGAVLLGIALADASMMMRAVVFFPLLAAAIGFFQYREKT